MEGNRVVKWRWYYNIFIVFQVSGFWHGANWTFIVWGALHGSYQIFGELTKRQRNGAIEALGLNRRPTVYKFVQVGTIFALVCLAWVFFRANTIGEAWYVTTHMFTSFGESVLEIVFNNEEYRDFVTIGSEQSNIFFSIILVVGLYVIELLIENDLRFNIKKLPASVRIAAYGAALVFIFLLGSFHKSVFIYFQF